MVGPNSKADEASGDHRQHHDFVADQPLLRDRDDHRRHHRRGGDEDDVDVGVAEEPEQVLIQQRVAATGGVEQRPVEGALEFQQKGHHDHCREGQDDHHAEDQHRPGVDRHLRQRHARCARAQHAHDEFDGAGDCADFDEANAQQPEVGVDALGVDPRAQWRVHKPATAGC